MQKLTTLALTDFATSWIYLFTPQLCNSLTLYLISPSANGKLKLKAIKLAFSKAHAPHTLRNGGNSQTKHFAPRKTKAKKSKIDGRVNI